MVRILEEGRHVFESTERLILSPQSEPGNVRRFLETNGFLHPEGNKWSGTKGNTTQ